MCKTIEESNLLDSATIWLDKYIENGEKFEFFTDDGKSKFGDSILLYKTAIWNESFLLTALEGKLSEMPFRYTKLLHTLYAKNNNEKATWVFCSEPALVTTNIHSAWRAQEDYFDSNILNALERARGDEIDWGNYYLLLIPDNRKWLFVNYYYFTGFEISLHGNTSFLEKVKSHNKSSKSTPKVGAI